MENGGNKWMKQVEKNERKRRKREDGGEKVEKKW